MDEGGIKFMAHEHLPPSRAPVLLCLFFLYPYIVAYCSCIDKNHKITKCIFFTCLVVPRLLSCAPSSFYIVTLSYISYIITKVLCIATRSRTAASLPPSSYIAAILQIALLSQSYLVAYFLLTYILTFCI